MSSAGKGVGFLEVTTRCYVFYCSLESALTEITVMRCEKTLSYAQRKARSVPAGHGDE